MNRKAIAMLLLTCAVAGIGMQSAVAADPEVPRAMLTGNMFEQMTAEQQLFTTIAMLEGVKIGAFVSSNDRLVKALNACEGGMTGQQALAIVQKYIAAHPENWDWQLGTLVFTAIKEACAIRGYAF